MEKKRRWSVGSMLVTCWKKHGCEISDLRTPSLPCFFGGRVRSGAPPAEPTPTIDDGDVDDQNLKMERDGDVLGADRRMLAGSDVSIST